MNNLNYLPTLLTSDAWFLTSKSLAEHEIKKKRQKSSYSEFSFQQYIMS